MTTGSWASGSPTSGVAHGHRPLPYDSDGGRALAASITSLMTGAAYSRSAEPRGRGRSRTGASPATPRHARVMRKRAAATDSVRSVSTLDGDVLRLAPAKGRGATRSARRTAGATPGQCARADRHHRLHDGLRHHRYRARLLAGEVQEAGRWRFDADRQPDDPAALAKLGYAEETIEAIVEYIATTATWWMPGLKPEHYRCSTARWVSGRSARWATCA